MRLRLRTVSALTVLLTASLCTAQVYSIDNGPPQRLVTVNPASGQVSEVGPLLLGGQSPGMAVQDMEFFDGRLFATLANFPGPAKLAEIDPSSGAVLSLVNILINGQPTANVCEGLGADAAGLVIALWTPAVPNISTSSTLGRLAVDGNVSVLFVTNSDFDGICADPASGGLIGVDRDPPLTTTLFRHGVESNIRTTITVEPINQIVDGIDEPALLNGRIVALDSVTRRVHQFDRGTGQLIASVPYTSGPSLYSLATRPCLPDLGSQGGVRGPDGQLNNDDFIVYIDLFFSQDQVADRGAQGGVPGVDGQFDSNDFIVFIDQFFAGC